jgi:hypothetical protein
MPHLKDQIGFTNNGPAFLSLLLRPKVCPEVPGIQPGLTMETRFFAPGSMVSNLDFVESVFGNAGDPYLPENDARWTRPLDRPHRLRHPRPAPHPRPQEGTRPAARVQDATAAPEARRHVLGRARTSSTTAAAPSRSPAATSAASSSPSSPTTTSATARRR